MIRLRISRRTLRILTGTAVALVAVGGLYGWGTAVTPRDAEGNPLLLSPSLRAAEQYRRRATRWAEQMATIDEGLTALLSEEEAADPAGLYAQSEEVQQLGEQAAGLTQEVTTAQVPVALVGLREQAQAASDLYLESAVLTVRWLSAPSRTSRREAIETLRTARALRVELETSPWLATN